MINREKRGRWHLLTCTGLGQLYNKTDSISIDKKLCFSVCLPSNGSWRKRHVKIIVSSIIRRLLAAVNDPYQVLQWSLCASHSRNVPLFRAHPPTSSESPPGFSSALSIQRLLLFLVILMQTQYFGFVRIVYGLIKRETDTKHGGKDNSFPPIWQLTVW